MNIPKEKLQELRDQFHQRKQNKSKLVEIEINYDDVFFHGVKWLNKLRYADDIIDENIKK